MLKHSTAENAIQSAQAILENSQHAANGAISGMSHALDHGVERARDASLHLRDSAHRVSQETSNVIRHDPVKSVLIAAATGAVLMALVGLLTRTYSRH
jgi:ElaB/YqjD/DUF883 family membrane-anchored ribosome-binding protein